MIPLTCFAGQAVAVFGLGGSGVASVEALAAGGARVFAWDDNADARTRVAGLDGVAVTNLSAADWSQFSALVLAPGVPLTHPEPHWTVEQAKAAGVEVIGDVELFFRQRAQDCPNAAVIAITGTNGKSTVTALIAHLLHTLGHDVEMGGNIGKAILSLARPSHERVCVVELSSYQIDLTPSLHPSVGVLLNVTPDHIDRHGTLERYAAIKAQLLSESDRACVGLDDGLTRGVADTLLGGDKAKDPARVYPFTCGKGAAVVPRLYAIGPTLFVHERDGDHSTSQQVTSLEGIGALRGQHNTQNALAALAAMRALQDEVTGLSELPSGDVLLSGRPVWDVAQLAAGLASFPGLAHRLEEVGRRKRVLFINDSKATNADSAAKALGTWERDIFWIAGGQKKVGGIKSLEPYFDRIAKAYFIGEAAREFEHSFAGHAPAVVCADLASAVFAAARDAGQSDGVEPVVLLSPACASFDQFANFEVRGDAFRSAVTHYLDDAAAGNA